MSKPDENVNIYMYIEVKSPLISYKTSPTAWSIVLQKLVVPQLVRKFFSLFETRIFITMFTAVCHLPQS